MLYYIKTLQSSFDVHTSTPELPLVESALLPMLTQVGELCVRSIVESEEGIQGNQHREGIINPHDPLIRP